MKAVVFHKPGDMRVEEVADPKIENPQDIILRVTSTAICGSDLHIYNGLMPQPKPMVMGTSLWELSKRQAAKSELYERGIGLLRLSR